MRVHHIAIVSLTLFWSTRAAASPTISGFVDGTYNYNFNDPPGGVSPYQSYTAQHNTFLLNTAHLAVAGSDDHFGYDVELDAGSDAKVNAGQPDDFDVQEAYVTYAHDSGFGLKVGKWATYQGIEVIESGANPTISRGFLFNLAEPFTHVGGVLTYQANDKIDVAVGAINGWDLVTDNNSLRTLVAKLGVTTDRFLLTASGYAGPEQAGNNHDWRVNGDISAVCKLSKVDLWLQVNAGTEQGIGHWAGAGIQPLFHVDDKLTLGARAEVFADPDAARTGTAQTLFNVSVAPGYAIHEHLTLRAEVRIDMSSEKPFVTRDGDAGSFQVLGLTEAIASF